MNRTRWTIKTNPCVIWSFDREQFRELVIKPAMAVAFHHSVCILHVGLESENLVFELQGTDELIRLFVRETRMFIEHVLAPLNKSHGSHIFTKHSKVLKIKPNFRRYYSLS